MKWLLKKWAISTIKRVIQIVLAWLAAHNIDKLGINLNVDQEVLSLAVWSAIEFLRSKLKLDHGLKWL